MPPLPSGFRAMDRVLAPGPLAVRWLGPVVDSEMPDQLGDVTMIALTADSAAARRGDAGSNVTVLAR
jgi:hypothetical protein